MCTVHLCLGCEGPSIAGQWTVSRGYPGDVNTAADADAMRELTGCDGVMVARAAMRNPWALRAIAARGGAAEGAAEAEGGAAAVHGGAAAVHGGAAEGSGAEAAGGGAGAAGGSGGGERASQWPSEAHACSDSQRTGEAPAVEPSRALEPSEAQVDAAAREHAALTAHLPSAARYAVFHTPNFERLRRGALEAELPRTRAPTADAGRAGGRKASTPRRHGRRAQ